MSTYPEEVTQKVEESEQYSMNIQHEELQKVEEMKHSIPREEQEMSRRRRPEAVAEEEGNEEQDQKEVESGRERLKRVRFEMAGRVWVPDIWGQERLLKDWIDCSAFDRSLFPSGLVSARTALVQECRRRSSGAGIVHI